MASVAGGAMLAAAASAVTNPCITDGFFFEPGNASGEQLLFLTIVYGAVLFSAAGLLSDGSELLLLVPSINGIVGTVVLPVLGAVPDGMMVFFSCLGEDAQEQVGVGVGALAGSTIMLLTIPWFLSILGGRVDMDADGNCNYNGKPKYTGTMESGVMISESTKVNGKMMMFTSLFYLIIQVPAFFYSGPTRFASSFEKPYALIGAVVCFVGLVGYLVIQVRSSSTNNVQNKIAEQRIAAIRSGEVTLQGCMNYVVHNHVNTDDSTSGYNSLREQDEGYEDLKAVLSPFFKFYDADKSGAIDSNELTAIAKDLRFDVRHINEMLAEVDADKSGTIEFDEFCHLILRLCEKNPSEFKKGREGSNVFAAPSQEESDVDEEEEIPEDLADLTPEQQQSRIKMRAAIMMGFGTLLVLVFSDPAVDVLSEIGVRTNIPAFYISFILAPLASNASELVAAYNYAQKKTTKTIGVSLSTLQGAACMNNTYCLFIFLVMIWIQGLRWEFTAETVAIVGVQMLVGVMCLKNQHSMKDAYLILSIYPLSLVAVWVMENLLGMD